MGHNCKIVLFLDDHRDTEILEVVTNLLPFFKEQNYKTIALEETSEKSQRDIVKQYRNLYKKVQDGQEQDLNNFTRDNYFLVKNATAQKFSLKSIDVSRKKFYELEEQGEAESSKIIKKLYKYSNKHSSFSQQELLKHDYVVDLWIKNSKRNFVTERDEYFVKKIDEICQKTDAGIIAIVGSMHARIINVLKALNYDKIHAFRAEEKERGIDFDSLMYLYNPEAVNKELFSSVDIININSIEESSMYIRGVIEGKLYTDEL